MENGVRMEESKLGLSAPWDTWAKKAHALFEQDDEVAIEYDGDAPSVTLLVDNPTKADALARLLPESVEFGNVTLGITVVPANDEQSAEQAFRAAFDGNPALAGTDVEALPDGTPVTFALFAPECAQWFADDLTNPYGLQTMTYEQVAKDVLKPSDVRITSDVVVGTVA